MNKDENPINTLKKSSNGNIQFLRLIIKHLQIIIKVLDVEKW